MSVKSAREGEGEEEGEGGREMGEGEGRERERERAHAIMCACYACNVMCADTQVTTNIMPPKLPGLC